MVNPLRQMLKRLTLAILSPTKAGLLSPPGQQMRGTIDKLKATLPAPIFLGLKVIYTRGAAVRRALRQPSTIGKGRSNSPSLYWLDLYGLRTHDSDQPACPEAKLINNILIENSKIRP